MGWKKSADCRQNKSAAEKRRFASGIFDDSAGGAEVAATVIADIGAAARIEGAVAVGAVTLPLRRPGLHRRADRLVILRLIDIDAARRAIDRSGLVVIRLVGWVDVAALFVNRTVIGIGDGRTDDQPGGKADGAADPRIVVAVIPWRQWRSRADASPMAESVSAAAVAVSRRVLASLFISIILIPGTERRSLSRWSQSYRFVAEPRLNDKTRHCCRASTRIRQPC